MYIVYCGALFYLHWYIFAWFKFLWYFSYAVFTLYYDLIGFKVSSSCCLAFIVDSRERKRFLTVHMTNSLTFCNRLAFVTSALCCCSEEEAHTTHVRRQSSFIPDNKIIEDRQNPPWTITQLAPLYKSATHKYVTSKHSLTALEPRNCNGGHDACLSRTVQRGKSGEVRWEAPLYRRVYPQRQP